MIQDPRRRMFLALIAALAVTAPAFAQPPSPRGFEGTWGGAAGDETAQVIVTGGQVIGFYWRGDYVDATDVRLSADGRVLSFSFAGGHATLTRTGDATASITATDGKGTLSIDLKRD
jgi:hypothetical protein